MADDNRNRTDLLGLVKPKVSDAVRVSDFNNNSDIMETEFELERNFSTINITSGSNDAVPIRPRSNQEQKDADPEWALSKMGDTLAITVNKGLSATVDGRSVTVGHEKSVTAKNIGSTQKGVQIWYDSYGHIYQSGEFAMYPPLEKGTAKQVWSSVGTGSGNGKWRDISAEKGIALSDSDNYVIGHEKTYAKAEVGGVSSIPRIEVDLYGHVMSVKGNAVYPPTTKGKTDQVYTSVGEGEGNGTWTTLDANSGISLTKQSASSTSDKKFIFGHSNSVDPKTNLGSQTAVPVISYDAQGHITKSETKVMYPPVTGADAGMFWRSEGADKRGSWANIGAGAGLKANWSFTGEGDARVGTYTLAHSNSVTAKSNVGSQTAVPVISYDAQGHITGTDTKIMYPPVSGADAGRIWASNGANTVGKWAVLGATDGLKIEQSNPFEGWTLKHTNSVTAGSKGSNTEIPVITWDKQGHVTAVDGTTVYPPTAKGTEYQVWTSSGTGAGNGRWITLSNGTGISITKSASEFKINHSNVVTAGSAGSATAIPVITWDGQGHLKTVSSSTVYPPTKAGTKGQLWVSKGEGEGVWTSTADISVGKASEADHATNADVAETAKTLNSGTVGGEIKPVYFKNGVPVAITHIIEKDVPSDAVFTDTKYTARAGGGLVLNGTEFFINSAGSTTRSTSEFVSSELLHSLLMGSKGVYAVSNTKGAIDERLTYLEGAVGGSFNPGTEDKSLTQRVAVLESEVDEVQGIITTAQSKSGLDADSTSTALATHKVVSSVKSALESSISGVKSTADSASTAITTGKNKTALDSSTDLVNCKTVKSAIDFEATARTDADSALNAKISTNATNINTNKTNIANLTTRVGNTESKNTEQDTAITKINSQISVINTALSGKQGTLKTATVTLTTAGWSSKKAQIIDVTGMTISCTVWVCPDVTSAWSWLNSGVYTLYQDDGHLAFICNSIPTNDLTVNVAFMV